MMRMLAISLFVATIMACETEAIAMEQSKEKEELSSDVILSRGLLDCTGAKEIDCNTTLYGEDNIGWPNNVEYYSCHTGWTEWGGERVYELTVEANTEINATLVPISGDSDIWLLGSCDETDCLAFGDISLTYNSVDGGTCYIVVDGHLYDPDCVYNLTVTCEEATPPPANDTCDGAIDLQQLGGQFIIDLCEYTNQYDPGEGGCTGWPASGPEAVYRIGLEEGEWFHASIDPVDEFIDLSLYLIADCADPVGSCVAGADEETFGPNSESIVYQAIATDTYYLLVDTWLTCDGGLTRVTYYTCTPSTDLDLVGHYPFNGAADDHSGYCNHGIVNGATLTSDRYGNLDSAYRFDGIDDFIEIPLTPPLTMSTNSFSVSCWINTNMEYSDPVAIIGNYRPYTTPHWGLGLNPNNPEELMRCGFSLRDQSMNTAQILTEDSVNDANWHHIVGIRNAEESIVEFRYDGQLIGVEEDVPGHVNSDQSVWIGVHLSRYYEGVIDDIRIYRRALTPEEVLALYNEPNPVSVGGELQNRINTLSCYPTPFNPQVKVLFTVGDGRHVELSVFDLTGRLLKVLAVGGYDAGKHMVDWNGRDSKGRAMSSGTYLVRMVTETEVVSKKVLLVR